MQGYTNVPKRFLLFLSLVLTVTAQHNRGHSHHGEVKSKWDEEEYLKWNPPTPPSYWSEDTSSGEELPARYPWLMVLHVLFMSGAFFVVLPAGEYFAHPSSASGSSEEACSGSPLPTPTYVPISCLFFDPWEPDRVDCSCIIRLCHRPGIALRSVKSSFHALSVVAFYGLVTLGLSSSALYKKLTPDL